MIKNILQIIQKLKQQTWTHIAAYLYLTLCTMAFVTMLFILVETSNLKKDLIILLNLFFTFSNYTIILIFFIAIILFYSNKICNYHKIENDFLLKNKKYNIIWLFGFITAVLSFLALVINKTIYFVFTSKIWEIGRSIYPNWYNKLFSILIIFLLLYSAFAILKHILGDNND